MKFSLKGFAFVATILGMTANGLALAAGPAKAEAGQTKDEAVHPDSKGGDWDEFRANKMEKLHASLKLTANQETAWKAWVDQFKSSQPARMEHHKEMESWASLPVPERMEKMLAFARERVSRLEERLTATKAFYAALSPEQRQTFDKEFGFGMHVHAGKHRHE